jgi:hypothetical protein
MNYSILREENKLKSIRGLTSIELESAYSRAARQIAGPKPDYSEFSKNAETPLGYLVLSGLILVMFLIVGFIPSAIRIFSYGKELFMMVIPDVNSSIAAAAAYVGMAEIGVVGFSLVQIFVKAPEEEGWRRYLSWTWLFRYGAMMSVLIAFVFNIEPTFAAHQGQITLAVLLEAAAPPFMVLLAAHGLMHIIVYQIEATRAANVKYNNALKMWHSRVSDPDTDSKAYKSALYLSIKDTIVKANRKEEDYIKTLNQEEWAKLIYAEISQGNALNRRITSLERQGSQLNPKPEANSSVPFP